jgi:hypothetical protein
VWPDRTKGSRDHPNLAKRPHTDLHERVDPLGDRSALVRLRLHRGGPSTRPRDADQRCRAICGGSACATVRSTACKIKEAVTVFQRSYLASFDGLCPAPALFAAAATLFEPQLTAVLLTMQRGNANLARRKLPITRDAGSGNSLPNRITLPLPEIEKWWLFPHNSPANCPYNRSLRESPACSCSCRSLKQTMQTRLHVLVPYADDA